MNNCGSYLTRLVRYEGIRVGDRVRLKPSGEVWMREPREGRVERVDPVWVSVQVDGAPVRVPVRVARADVEVIWR